MGVIVAARRANPQDSQLIRRGVWVRRRRDGSEAPTAIGYEARPPTGSRA